MTALPWMPLHIADYLADTGHLSVAEHGAYLLLIMHYWQNGHLPTDDMRLARICRMQPEEWEAVRDILSDFFNDDWRHKRIEEELAAAREIKGKRSAAGKAGASARYGNRTANAEQTNAPAGKGSCSGESSFQPQFEGRASEAAREFETKFWPKYPHQVGLPKARAAFLIARRKASVDEILAGVERYRLSKPPDRDWMNPDKFLAEERWLDKPAGKNAGTPSTQPMTWVLKDSPQWLRCVSRWRETHGRDPPATGGNGGVGWHFPTDWLTDTAKAEAA